MSTEEVMNYTVASRCVELKLNEDGTHSLEFVSAREPYLQMSLKLQPPLMVTVEITEDVSVQHSRAGKTVMQWSHFPVDIHIKGLICRTEEDNTIHSMKIVSSPYGDERDDCGRKRNDES